MLRPLDIVMIAALIGGAGYTFKIKHDAEKAVERVEYLETRIRLELEAIDILKADWSLLTSPDRLEALVRHHEMELQLKPVEPVQVGRVSDIPLRATALPPIDEEQALTDQPDRSTLTGSVPDGGDARKVEGQ